MDLGSLLVFGFATWRIARLIAGIEELGPGNILVKLRYRMGVRYDEYSEPYGKYWFSGIFSCPNCASVWVGFFLALLYIAAPEIAFIIALPFALSGVALVLNRGL